VEWAAIESLLKAIGCDVIEGNGSHMRFVKDWHAASFHRPHPVKGAKAYQRNRPAIF
jgi:predicted RNA binding protein YcfA (HicA-like mRNA interferase family)